ncbi:MAG: hypothetical protein H8E82_06845 [Candidatus Marinimicrobia bacterium]|nr:hypothetical protein [Candidatus Neomarinimicrobiota bacterium]
MRLRLISLLTLFLIFISYYNAQQTVQKKYCMSSIGYQGTSDELRTELLANAKRLAVSEFFGEFISSYTEVENFLLTEDRIVASSAGFVRIKGSPVFESSDNFGEVCVLIDAYVTKEDIDKFKPVTITKRHCVSDPDLPVKKLKKYAKEEAIIVALLDYDRNLEVRDKKELLPLVRDIKYLESGFIRGTESYCVTFEGFIYPIEILSLISQPIVKREVEKPIEKILFDFTDKNLLKNPGAELGIQSWDVNTNTYTTRSRDPSPHSGSNYFYPGLYKSKAVASQIIDLRLLSKSIDNFDVGFIIIGFMRDFEGSRANGDISQIEVDFLSGNEEIIQTIKSPEVAISEYWVRFEKKGNYSQRHC